MRISDWSSDVCSSDLPGWGETLYLKDVFPDTPLLGFFEFYYHSVGADVGFDPESPVTLDTHCRIRTKNIIQFMGLEAADAGMAPTQWQFQQYPQEYRHKISVIHDGKIGRASCRERVSQYG